jgi:putative nucleotidyltransferase with HDIG domain
MSPELSQKLATAVDHMPAFPQSVQKILEMTRDSVSIPKEMIQIIDRDPVMTLKILRVVNSAYYSLPRQITSINHAAVYLGINTIKNLALCIAAIGMLPKTNQAGFNMQQYLLHSLTTAGIAKRLALQFDDVDPMDGFIAGLLHDFGKVVLAQFMPETLEQAINNSKHHLISLHESLRRLIGVDHAAIGAMLAEKWHFAPSLVETIRNQNDMPLRDTSIIACVFAANQISKKLNYGFAGNIRIEELPPAIAARFDGTLDQLIDRLGSLTPVYEEARLFAQLEGDA